MMRCGAGAGGAGRYLAAGLNAWGKIDLVDIEFVARNTQTGY